MAEETVDEAIKLYGLRPGPVLQVPRISGTEMIDDSAPLDGTCQTHQVRLIGAHGFSKTLFIQLIQHFGVATDVAKHLCESYGDRGVDGRCTLLPHRAAFPCSWRSYLCNVSLCRWRDSICCAP